MYYIYASISCPFSSQSRDFVIGLVKWTIEEYFSILDRGKIYILSPKPTILVVWPT
jgi:hypothetical protein